MKRINKFRIYPPTPRFSNFLPQFLFLSAIVISTFTTYYATGHFLDSDASSELVLAEHLLETGQILSRDWFYGSELRVLHMQWVYVPLLIFFNSWQLVRFVGALLLQAIYILSFAFLCHEAGISKRNFFLCSSLLLLPVSVTYGRIILYHCHYIPNISISFLLLGLVLGFPQNTNLLNFKVLFRLVLLTSLSFLGGLSGVRQLMMTHAPMILSIFILALTEDSKNSKAEKAAIVSPEFRHYLVLAMLALLSSFAGLKVNTNILSKYLTTALNQNDNSLAFMKGTDIDGVLYGFFHQFGFRADVAMLSLSGVLSLGAIFVGVYALITAIKKLQHYKKEHPKNTSIFYSFFLSYTIIMITTFLVTGGNQKYYFPLYLVFCYPWAVPLLVANLDDIPTNVHFLHEKKLLAWSSVFLLVISGMVNLVFF